MGFPVDVMEATSHKTLRCSADSYMNELLYSDPDHAHYFTLPSGEKVQLSLSNVGPVPLYGVDSQHNVLALFTPQDQHTVVALYLNSQWYSVEDILKTANSTREGLIKVRSVGERIVLYILNTIVYRTKELGSGEMPFLCHNENDYAKILWKNGQAVGFYSVKPKGSIYNNYLEQCYVLPVMDSMFVRKAHQRKDYRLQMLEDFVDSFQENELGLKYPLSPAMKNVCRHYLNLHPADVDLFWEVEGVGGPYQRTRVAYILTSGPLKEIDTQISTFTWGIQPRRRTRVRDEEEANGVGTQPDKINRVETAEVERKKEFGPADGPETLVLKEPDDTHTVDMPEEPAAEQQNVAPAAERDQEVDTAAEEPPSPLPTHLQKEVTDVVNDISEQSPNEEPSREKENTLREEEVKAVLKEDEMDEDGDEKNVNTPSGFSVVLRRSRNKAVPPTSRRTTKRLRKKALEKEEKGTGRTVGGRSGRGRQQKERRRRKGNQRRGGRGRGRAQLRRGGGREVPAVIFKMVLRGKTKLIQPTRQTRSKRQNKI